VSARAAPADPRRAAARWRRDPAIRGPAGEPGIEPTDGRGGFLGSGMMRC